MSCPDFVISAGGRAAVGVDQGIAAGDYPLVAPSEDIAGLIADMYFAYDDLGLYVGQPAKKYPFSIKYLSGLGCLAAMSGVPAGPHAADIKIVDVAGDAVFDSFTAAGVTYAKTAWSADYDIHEWRSEYAVCRVVTYKTWPATDKNDTDATAARNYSSRLAPASAVISARAVYRMPKRLLSMRVKTGGTITNKTKSEIVFKNGYNTEITASSAAIENFRFNTRIAVSGVAGSGLGRFFNCADTITQPVITSINGVSPNDSGDFVMGGKDCLWSVHPLIVTPAEEENAPASIVRDGSAGIKFGGDCKACCSCEDYVEAAEYMNQVAYRYQLVGQRAQEVYTQHETNVANWETATCDVGEVLKMAARSQECGAIDIALTLCNTCNTCIPASTLLLDLYVPEPPDSIVPIAIEDIFIGRGQRSNVHGNTLVHELDCSYTKINGATVDAPVATEGSFELQFGLSDVITASGQPELAQTLAGGNLPPAIPQIKPKSFVWPTYVTNVFTGGYDVTEYMYDPGADYMTCRRGEAETTWAISKGSPTYYWRGGLPFTNSRRWQAVNVYGIRLEDNEPLPLGNGIDIRPYLMQKYYPPRKQSDPFVPWGSVGDLLVEGDVAVPPAAHNRWWSSIGTYNFFGDTAEVSGSKEVRTYEIINEAQIGAIISAPAAVAALAEHLEIPPASVANDIFIGVRVDAFASDVVPSVGLSIVDKFGLFSSWSPEGTGVTGFWPATIKGVHPDDAVVWLRIARPTAPTDRNIFPYINIPFPNIDLPFEFSTTDQPEKIPSAIAQAFKTIRFYNMKIFGEHVKIDDDGGFVNPWVLDPDPTLGFDQTNYWFNSIGAVATANTTSAEWSKPDRYIRAKTPRRIKINTPAIMPGGTIQIDLRVVLRELAFLAYAGEYTTADWSTCADNAIPLKFCARSELSAGGLALYDGADKMEFRPGTWSPYQEGEDGIFYSHIPAKEGNKLVHPNITLICPPPWGFLACDPLWGPEYWRLLRWTKTFDQIVLNADLLSEDEYKRIYACTKNGVFNGVVEFTPQESDDPDVEPTTRVKVCGFTFADNNKPLTKRKITPRGAYSIEMVLTGRKPTASSDLTKQHILADGCESQSEAKKAYVAKTIQLNCDLDGRTPSC